MNLAVLKSRRRSAFTGDPWIMKLLLIVHAYPVLNAV